MPIKYGLISEVDSSVIEKTLRLVFYRYQDIDDTIRVTEVGIYAGETGNGMREYIQKNGRIPCITGIDNGKDSETLRFDYNYLFIGNSDEMAFNIKDESQHIILIDACHCFAHTVSDFFSFAPKVKDYGYIIFHDTGNHIRPFTDFQHGDKNNPDAYISCRKALSEIGLFANDFPQWQLIFDEADRDNLAGGVSVFMKNKMFKFD